nr:unnamed protein product [Callosobruchus chinensis]
MPPWWHVTPYKGLFLLVLIFVGLEYFFSTFSDTGSSLFFNTTKLPIHATKVLPLHLKPPLLLKTFNFTSTNGTTTFRKNSSALVTDPSSSGNGSSTASSSSTADLISTVDSDYTSKATNATGLPPCPEDVSMNLHGRIPIIRTPVPTVLELERRFSWLLPGGSWRPPNCRPPKRVAIIVPFRCRGEHLLLFLQHMHPFFKRQMLDYTIFIVEQDGDGPFNRAMLMNIGYKEALNGSNYDCFIFHDIDLLPEDDRNLYTCPDQPRHMSVAVDIFKYKLPYSQIFGGVSAITRDHFKLLNGFSNSFWGWGGEDDDMSNRIRYHQLHISRYPITIARYTMLTHKKDKPSPNRYDVLKQGQKRFDKDGLNNLKYKLVQKKRNLLYTWLLVSIKPPS